MLGHQAVPFDTNSFVMPVSYTTGGCEKEAGLEENVWLLNVKQFSYSFLFRRTVYPSQLLEGPSEQEPLHFIIDMEESPDFQTRYVICRTTHLPWSASYLSIPKEMTSCSEPWRTPKTAYIMMIATVR